MSPLQIKKSAVILDEGLNFLRDFLVQNFFKETKGSGVNSKSPHFLIERKSQALILNQELLQPETEPECKEVLDRLSSAVLSIVLSHHY